MTITVTNSTPNITVDNTTNTVTVTEQAQNITVVTSVSKNDIGLGNVDNTSDVNKPISSATQSALDSKVSSANPGFSGTVTLADGVIITGSTDWTNRASRPTFKGSTGTSTGVRIVPPSTATNNIASISASTTADVANTDFINLSAKNGTNGLRIQTGNYTNNVLANTTQDVTFLNNATLIGTVNHSGTPTNSMDLTTKAYVDAKVPRALDVLADGTATTDSLPQGSTNLYYTDGLVQSYLTANSYAKTADITTAVNNLVAGAPSALDTLKELADAINDDANFAASVTASLANKANTASLATVATSGSYTDLSNKPTLFSGSYTDLSNKPSLATVATSGSYTDLSNKPTLFSGSYTDLSNKPSLATVATSGSYTDLSNQPTLFSGSYTDLSNKPTIPTVPTTISSFTNDSNYITTSGARSAISAGTGISYNSSTGVISTSQDLSTTATPTFAGLTSTGTTQLPNYTQVLGEIHACPDSTISWPLAALTTTSTVGYAAYSSAIAGTIGGNTVGTQTAANYTHFYGDTLAGTNTAPAFTFQAANGNSVPANTLAWTGAAGSSASAVVNTSILGAFNFSGYATNNWATYIASRYQGGGINPVHPGQIQMYATETFADGTLTISGSTISAVSRVSVALSSVSVTGTKGQISFTSTTPSVGAAIVVTGTNTGTATGISAGTYYIIATNGSTTAQLSAVPGGYPITTTSGTTTGLTFTRQLITVTYNTQSNIPFGLNAMITISGFTNVTSGTYMALGTSTTTSVNIGAPSSGTPSLSGSQSMSLSTVTNAATAFRVRSIPAATPLNSGNRINIIDHSAASATYRADSFVITGGAYGNTSTARMTVDVNKAAFTVPLGTAVYTASALRAITGSAGWHASVSDNSGKIAYWDTTNSRWSYIKDDSAV